jgi:hypothetical protein
MAMAVTPYLRFSSEPDMRPSRVAIPAKLVGYRGLTWVKATKETARKSKNAGH